MAKTEEEIPVCGAQYQMRFCQNCEHQRWFHADNQNACIFIVDMGATEDEMVVCDCLSWTDSGTPVVLCVESEGFNAMTDPVMEEGVDENGNPTMVEITPPQPRHVHKGFITDSSGKVTEIVRWESSV